MHLVIACKRMRIVTKESDLVFKIENLNFFNKNFENVQNILRNWVFSAIKTPFLSVILDFI